MGDIASKWSNLSQGLIPGLEQHIENLPDIAATTSGPEYFQKSTADMIQNLSTAYGKAPIVGDLNQFLIETTAPVLSAVTSLPYDFYEATQRMEPGSGIKGLYSAWQNEQPWTAMKNRFIGAAQPFANRITNTGTSIGEGIYDYIHGPRMRFRQQQFMNKKKQGMQRRIREGEKKRIEQEKIKAAQDNWKPTYNPASSHAEAQATGGDYHGGQKSTVDGQTTDWGPSSHMIAGGGLAQRAPRGSYFNGGLASLYRHGRF